MSAIRAKRVTVIAAAIMICFLSFRLLEQSPKQLTQRYKTLYNYVFMVSYEQQIRSIKRFRLPFRTSTPKMLAFMVFNRPFRVSTQVMTFWMVVVQMISTSLAKLGSQVTYVHMYWKEISFKADWNGSNSEKDPSGKVTNVWVLEYVVMQVSKGVVSMGPLYLRASILRNIIMDLEKTVPVDRKVKMLLTELWRSIWPFMLNFTSLAMEMAPIVTDRPRATPRSHRFGGVTCIYWLWIAKDCMGAGYSLEVTTV